MTESRSVICNLTKKNTRTGSQFACPGPEVSLRMRTGKARAIFLVKLQFAVQDNHFFNSDENEFRGAGNVKRIETSAQITSMKSKSSAAEAIGRTKKKKKKEERIERKGRK